MKKFSNRSTSAVIALALTVTLLGCGSSDSASDTTAAPDTTVAESSTTSSVESTTTVASSSSVAKKPAYCSMQTVLKDTDMSALTNAQATKASTEIDANYSTLTAEMKTHAGPLLDFLIQWSTMGGGAVNPTYVDHKDALLTLVIAACD